MGRPKPLVEVDGRPMALAVADAALAGGCRGVVLIGGDPTLLAPLGLDIVADRFPGEGPLGGIVTALTAPETAQEIEPGPETAPAASRDDAVLVLPCDVPFIDATTVHRLLAGAIDAPDADVVVAVTDRVQPGCALWRRSAAAAVEQRFVDGERAVHQVLAELSTVQIGVSPAALRNINDPADLAEPGGVTGPG